MRSRARWLPTSTLILRSGIGHVFVFRCHLWKTGPKAFLANSDVSLFDKRVGTATDG